MPGYTEYTQALEIEISEFMTGKKSAKAALDSAAKKWNEITDGFDRRSSGKSGSRSSRPTRAREPGVTAAVTRTTVEREAPGRTLRPGARRSRLARPRLRWLLIAPAVLLLIAFTVYPFIYALFVSTHTWKVTYPVSPTSGSRTTATCSSTTIRFINAIERTAIITVAALAIEFVFGFVMALLFWRAFHRVRWLATLILLPMLISPVVVGFTARMAFTDSYGFVNQILSLLVPGGDVSPNWLSSPTLAPLVVILPTRGSGARSCSCCCSPGCSRRTRSTSRRRGWTARATRRCSATS